jgi:4-hydroxy-tetrahydrodipicolinate synthase
MAAGAKGGIIVTASALPKTWKQLYELCSQGKQAEALALHRKLIPLLDMAFAETNPGPLKSVLDLVGIAAPRVLQPLVAPATALQDKLRAEMASLLRDEKALA